MPPAPPAESPGRPTDAARAARPGIQPALLDALTHDALDPSYAAAAGRSGSSGRRARARRPVALLSLLAVGLLLGLAVGYGRATLEVAQSTRAALARDVASRSESNLELSRTADQLAGEIAVLRAEALRRSQEGRAAQTARDRLEAAVAARAVTGPGVVITLTDGGGDGSDGAAQQVGRVLDRDLQDVVNALWVVGAEAIAVGPATGPVRLGPTTAIRSAGGTILADFRPLVAPYEVRAIGDPAALQERFAESAAAARLAILGRELGIGATVRAADHLELPAATLRLPQRARPGDGS